MQLLINILLFAAISYHLFQFIVFMNMRKEQVVIPATEEERTAIRKHAQSNETHQKENVIPYMLILSAIIILFGLGFIFSNESNWTFNLMLLLLLFNSSNLLNGFSIIQDGLLTDGRFIPWKRIKEFEFVSIDINHRFYGYSKEVNGGYELKIKGKFFGCRCFVTTEEMKEKLFAIMSEQVEENDSLGNEIS